MRWPPLAWTSSVRSYCRPSNRWVSARPAGPLLSDLTRLGAATLREREADAKDALRRAEEFARAAHQQVRTLVGWLSVC